MKALRQICAVLALAAGSASAQVIGMGASVSGGWAGTPPGELLAGKLGLAYRGETHIGARGGNSRLLPFIPDDVFAADIVMGVDLFFWDSYHNDCAVPIAAMDELFKRAGKGRALLILGNVPKIDVSLVIRLLALVSGHTQKCRDAINVRLTERCTRPRCIVLDVDRFVRDVPVGVALDGAFYRGTDLMPDGLHISTVAGEVMAREALEQLRAVSYARR
jgi:hypothetical protein